ncbi:hypothetical protein BC826DRAFT_1003256 [Russula brevipes]|nr:hypothetical protein BC826DRAFT_1003256 [Russula brevipes]
MDRPQISNSTCPKARTLQSASIYLPSGYCAYDDRSSLTYGRRIMDASNTNIVPHHLRRVRRRPHRSTRPPLKTQIDAALRGTHSPASTPTLLAFFDSGARVLCVSSAGSSAAAVLALPAANRECRDSELCRRSRCDVRCWLASALPRVGCGDCRRGCLAVAGLARDGASVEAEAESVEVALPGASTGRKTWPKSRPTSSQCRTVVRKLRNEGSQPHTHRDGCQRLSWGLGRFRFSDADSLLISTRLDMRATARRPRLCSP